MNDKVSATGQDVDEAERRKAVVSAPTAVDILEGSSEAVDGEDSIVQAREEGYAEQAFREVMQSTRVRAGLS